MDLIGSIKLIENTLGRRSSGKPGQSAATNIRNRAVQEKKHQPDQNHFSAWDEIQLGRNIDTTA